MKMPTPVFFALSTLLALGTGAALMAAPTTPTSRDSSATGMFPFVIPWDRPGATAVNASSLNDGPAGSHGFIVARNGHFVESETGRRIRFLGVDFTFAADFPEHADAEKVAARIAAYGVNLVRLHHMDNGYGARGSIISTQYPDHRHLNPEQLDRLDYLIAQLKKNGVYVNINLHVSRQFTPADGFPTSVNELPGMDKRVDYFDHRMIELQKEYARELLTHRNPYTGTTYTDEPAVLNVELTNEDSLVGDPWATAGGDLVSLPEPFRGELQTLWNSWLRERYGTTASMQRSWMENVTPSGPNMLGPTPNPATWQLENHDPAHASITPDDNAIRARIDHVDGTDWHIQLKQAGLNLKDGYSYTLRFRAKADAARDLPVGTTLDQPDWHGTGLAAAVHLTTDWAPYEFSFEARNTVPNHSRLSFTLGGATGTVWVSDVQLSPGSTAANLPRGHSLENGNVPLPDSFTPRKHNDWIAFLASVERRYDDSMSAYLKDDLHLHSMIIGSQISWGGVAGLYREASMPFADNHAYWQHPSFPHKPWDPVDWSIGNSSMIPVMGSGDELTRLAVERVTGKPYSISEYNMPAPNLFQAEVAPLYASFAAAQDWDAIYLFDYGDYGAGANDDQIQGFFAVGSNPTKWAFMPAAARIFRAAQIPAAPGEAALGVPADVERLVSRSTEEEVQQWRTRMRPTAGENRLSIAMPGRTAGPTTGAPPPLKWNVADPATATYSAVSPSAIVLAGFVANQRYSLGSTTFQFGPSPNGFASLALVAMDGKPWILSRQILLTVVDRVENTGMVWNAEQNSVNNHWGGPPTLADPVSVTVQIPCDGPRRVFALDSAGKEAEPVESHYDGKGTLMFQTGARYHTIWYAVEPED